MLKIYASHTALQVGLTEPNRMLSPGMAIATLSIVVASSTFPSALVVLICHLWLVAFGALHVP